MLMKRNPARCGGYIVFVRELTYLFDVLGWSSWTPRVVIGILTSSTGCGVVGLLMCRDYRFGFAS